MITKMKETNILSGNISNQNWDNSLVLKWLKRWQNPTLFLGIFTFQLKKTVQYRKDLKDHKTLHPLWGHSKPNWKRQFIIEMITKMTEHNIVCGDIQHPIEKDNSVLKWLQRWQNITFFVGTFKFRLKKTVQYRNDFKDHRTIHPL